MDAFARPKEAAPGVVAVRARRTPTNGWIELDVVRESDPVDFETILGVVGVGRYGEVVTSFTLLGPRHVTVYVYAWEDPAAWHVNAPSFFDREDASLYLHTITRLWGLDEECPKPGPRCTCTYGMGMEWQFMDALDARVAQRVHSLTNGIQTTDVIIDLRESLQERAPR